MHKRFPALHLVLASALAGAVLGYAVERVAAQGAVVEPPDKLPKSRVDQGRSIDVLFEALKAAPDEESAKLVENRIWALWFASGSDTVDLLMSRVKSATDDKELDLAIEILDKIVAIKPEYAEGWNRRATLYFMKKDYGRSIADIAQVLSREPRHFGALTGLGAILQELGDDRHALETYRRALAIYPKLQKVPDLIKTLSEKVEGRDI